MERLINAVRKAIKGWVVLDEIRVKGTIHIF